MTTQDMIRERQRKRTTAFNSYAGNVLNGEPVSREFVARQRQFGMDDSEDTRALNDANYVEQQARWANPMPQLNPNRLDGISGPQVKGLKSFESGATMGGKPYIEATNAVRTPLPPRNNFSGAENAPEGAVVRGIDKQLYRRSGGQFVRLALPSSEDFSPAAPSELPFTIHGKQQTIASAGPNPTAGLYRRTLNGKTDYYGAADVQPKTPAVVNPNVGASSMGFDSMPAGRANMNRQNDTLEQQAYDFGVNQDKERDARTIASYSTAGAYRDMNRRSPRYGQTISTFDPGEVNPNALTKPRRVPVARTF